ncbi:MAG: S24 family peptidase [Gammaproteobacteria bacterium]
MNVKDIRRHNLRELCKGVGSVTALSKLLKKSQAQISHLIGKTPTKNIGDRLAAQIEVAFEKPHGWLDKLHDATTRYEELVFTTKTQNKDNLYWLPLIEWSQLSTFTGHSKDTVAIACGTLPTQLKTSKKSFAVRADHHQLAHLGSITAAKENIIVIDRKAPLNNDAIVIVADPNSRNLSVCRYNPNASAPNTVSSPEHVVGVVLQIISTFE